MRADRFVGRIFRCKELVVEAINRQSKWVWANWVWTFQKNHSTHFTVNLKDCVRLIIAQEYAGRYYGFVLARLWKICWKPPACTGRPLEIIQRSIVPKESDGCTTWIQIPGSNNRRYSSLGPV
jgi:hypothetical protein